MQQPIDNLSPGSPFQPHLRGSSAGQATRAAIQGERGSNSHMAAVQMLGRIEVVPCSISAEVIQALLDCRVDTAVLPIENSLHGSVAEHYDLLLAHPVRIVGESLLRIRHNLIAAPGVEAKDIRKILSHPVALSQCRRFLQGFSSAQAIPFYDTAGSVKHIMESGLRDTAAIAPELAATEYGAHVLQPGVEDHAQNYTRFYQLLRSEDAHQTEHGITDKLSVAFAIENRPGTLVAALERLRDSGVDLTRIESRPVPGKPWEYVFYVEQRFGSEAMADRSLAALAPCCSMVKELGRYKAAEPIQAETGEFITFSNAV